MIEARLVAAYRAMVRAFVNDTPPCLDFAVPYRYRVVRMAASGRVELQAVRKRAGLPDVLPISILPGVPGASSVLTPGSIVLVTFIEGDSTLPIVTHFAREGEPGWLPVSVALDATGEVRVGETAASVKLAAGLQTVIRDGDTITVTPGNSAGPVTGVVTLTVGIPPIAPSRVKA